ncbi:MAG: CAP domain-containing protein [Myxococcota bacterium]|nr:CAP domain-containing protein [Myxococcota bacterium]
MLLFFLACNPSSETHEDSTTPSSPVDDRDPLSCDVIDLYDPVPVRVEGNTSSTSDLFSSSCSEGEGSGSSDIAYRWIPAESGFYRIHTLGSDFDTVLTLYEANCNPEELVCNDDADSETRQSELRLHLEAEEELLIVIDGYNTDNNGQTALQIDLAERYCEDGLDDDNDGQIDCDDPDCSAIAPTCNGQTCPEEALPASVPQTVIGSTLGAGSTLGYASCGNGGSTAPERSFSFTAPETGPYRIDTKGSTYDTTLYIREQFCTGIEIACNDDGGGDLTSAIQIDMEEGQTIIIVVDGWYSEGGDFQLNISGVEQSCEDGIDNDGDGDVDCDDPDCASVECILGSSWPDDWASVESDMLSEVNARRAEGATCDTDYYPPTHPLEMNEYLRLAARLHSYDMGTQNYFEHTGLDGRSPGERVEDVGFPGAGPVGENISGGYSTAAESVEGLMNSPGHCRNIMDPDYHVIGIGYFVEPNSDLVRYWTQNFGGSH